MEDTGHDCFSYFFVCYYQIAVWWLASTHDYGILLSYFDTLSYFHVMKLYGTMNLSVKESVMACCQNTQIHRPSQCWLAINTGDAIRYHVTGSTYFDIIFVPYEWTKPLHGPTLEHICGTRGRWVFPTKRWDMKMNKHLTCIQLCMT